ncbi:MAG: amino acid ABC transporter substrate-binding protein [Salinisphaera sp.]|jgi:branched-chain amino acid transport system substrate-binding protein|nr:amino acid ABC transporter substrate-binding protein [Salinisphaera sp.]
MYKMFAGVLLALGVILPGMALAQKTITIGFTTSETGKLNADAAPQLRGFELWRDQVNADGGIKAGGTQYKVALKHYDDQSSAGRVQQLYTRLILQDNADFLFSPYSSGLTSTAAVVSEQFGKIMITTGAAEGKTYKLGNRYLFQMYTPADEYLTSALQAIKSKDPNAKIALVYSNDGFSKGAADGAAKAAKSMGLNVVLTESYAPNTTDFGPVINKIVSSGANVLIGGGHYADGSTLARQLYDKKSNLEFISLLVAPDIPKFASLGKAARGVTVPSQWEPTVAYKPDFGPTPEQFREMFQKKYNTLPGYHAAGGYAAGLVLQHAIEQAGSIKTPAVAKALNAMDATTAYGHIKFADGKQDHGLQVGHDMVLAQWQKGDDGKLHSKVVWPKSAANAKLVFPLTTYHQ